MTKAYSYRRFSSAKQRKGDSVRRQDEARDRYLAEHTDLVFDDSIKPDMGVSARKGKNRKRGSLGDFLALIKAGKVAAGSVLMIESLDRLSREQLNKALRLFMDIIESGVKIVTFTPFKEYDQASLTDIVGLLEPLVYFSRAAEESLIKEERGRAKWTVRRAGMQGGKRHCLARAMLPAWIKNNDAKDGFEIDEPAAETVRLIFKLAAKGHGHVAIAKKLNKMCVKPIGKKNVWNYSYVGMILRSRQVLGEFQPCEVVHVDPDEPPVRRPVGPPIENYFPRVITTKLFDKVQAAVKGRAQPRGRQGENIANLFTGLLVDARDGASFRMRSGFRDEQGERCRHLLNARCVNGEPAHSTLPRPCRLAFRYDVFEAAILAWVKELRLDDLAVEPGTGTVDLARLLERRAEVEATIAQTRSRLTDGGGQINILLDLLVQLQERLAQVQAAIDDLMGKTAANGGDVLGAAKSLIDQLDTAESLSAKGQPSELADVRERLKAKIRTIVDRIYVLFWVDEHTTRKGEFHAWARLQVHLRGGQIRHIFIRNDGQAGDTLVHHKMAPSRDLRNFRESGMENLFPASFNTARAAARAAAKKSKPAKPSKRSKPVKV